jgi:hypothetical protein
VDGVTAVTRLLAFVLLAALVGCVAASAAGRHRAAADPGIVACFVALVACLLRLRLRGGRR